MSAAAAESTIRLTRFENTKDGVFGKMYLNTGVTLCTMEDDWLFNKRRISSIPSGVYELVRTIYHRHNIETFEVVDVPGRDRILVHVANTEEDVEGCIGVGLDYGQLKVRDEDTPGRPWVFKKGVTSSRLAFDLFMQSLQGRDRWPFIIQWAPNVSPEG